VAIESFGIPVPGETALIAFGVLASQGHYSIAIAIVMAVAAAAAIVGDNLVELQDRPPPCREGVGVSPILATVGARLQGLSLDGASRRSGELCRETSQDVAMRRAYRECTRDVPACCKCRRQHMPICRHFVEAL
jgi:hypothetical protein